MRLTILGCGTLGETILGGLLASGVDAADVVVTGRRDERMRELAERYGVRALLDNAAAVAAADVALLTVKPQAAAGVLAGLDGALGGGKLLISACAGVAIERIRAIVGDVPVIRAMPNTPARIREGMTVLAPGPGVDAAALARAERIFAAVGRVRVLEEKHMDVVTGLSGSGPAFAFVILEALADGGVMMGLPRDAAIELAAQTVQGAARLALHTREHPAALKDQVTTPAGCTIAGLLTLEDGRIRSTLARAIQEATRVAGGLGG
ncbi:MAG: pyrroline-5-carboxylate reductase [Planctomycetes bacterium]|nr:pyrroline-5-carboxylate reductase [Planctomycetota bacterium]